MKTEKLSARKRKKIIDTALLSLITARDSLTKLDEYKEATKVVIIELKLENMKKQLES